MAIVIDVLEETIIPADPQFNIPASRFIKYTARENGGTMFYHTAGGFDGSVSIEDFLDSTVEDPPTVFIPMREHLHNLAEAGGTAIDDLITWVYIEKKRKPVYRDGWSIVRNQVGDTAVTNVSPTWNYQFNILVELAQDSALAANFQANAWRLGLIANKDVQITRAVIDGLTGQQRVTLYLLTLSFMGLGHGIGVDGSFILDEVLPD